MTEKQEYLRLLLPVYVIFLIIYIIASIIEPTFYTWGNNINLFTRIAPLIIVGVAQTIVILIGGIDLSLGAIIGLTNSIAVSMPFIDSPVNTVLWLIFPPIIGFLAGYINGQIITRGGFPPLIVTLATSQIFTGISLFILSQPGGKISKGVASTVTGLLFKTIPIPLIIIIVIIIVFSILLRNTVFGRSIYAVGGNELIALESGIPIQRIKVWVYSLSGFLAGITGIYLSAVMNSGDPLVGNPYTLNSVAVAVIGGTSLSGGIGGILGVFGAAYIYQLLNNILNLLKISTFYQYVVKGLVLIIALSITSSGTKIKIKSLLKGNKIKEQIVR